MRAGRKSGEVEVCHGIERMERRKERRGPEVRDKESEGLYMDSTVQSKREAGKKVKQQVGAGGVRCDQTCEEERTASVVFSCRLNCLQHSRSGDNRSCAISPARRQGGFLDETRVGFGFLFKERRETVPRLTSNSCWFAVILLLWYLDRPPSAAIWTRSAPQSRWPLRVWAAGTRAESSGVQKFMLKKKKLLFNCLFCNLVCFVCDCTVLSPSSRGFGPCVSPV